MIILSFYQNLSFVPYISKTSAGRNIWIPRLEPYLLVVKFISLSVIFILVLPKSSKHKVLVKMNKILVLFLKLYDSFILSYSYYMY